MKIVSGGQTGVDRAALDAAIELGLEHGGWCPRGRLAEDGPIDPCYNLAETPSQDYPQRTEWNVRDSDATLVLSRKPPSGGTAYTMEMVNKHQKPSAVAGFGDDDLARLKRWLAENRFDVLNVAGPRESSEPGIYDEARGFLVRLFTISS